MIPFLKWPGGKRWLSKQLTEKIGHVQGRYYEPFVGAGAVLFELAPNQATIADLNPALIEVYKEMKANPIKLKQLISSFHNKHSRDFYYEERKRKYENRCDRAAQFLYLNRACFNGIYRVNLRGEFNVPIGSKDKILLPSDNFNESSRILKNVKIQKSDFERIVDQADAGDVVFADPPYTVRHNMNGFIKYNEKLFSWTDQERLASSLSRAKSRGARIFLSNANHQSIIDLYSSPSWYCTEIYRRSVIAASSSKRGETSELLISSEPLISEIVNRSSRAFQVSV